MILSAYQGMIKNVEDERGARSRERKWSYLCQIARQQIPSQVHEYALNGQQGWELQRKRRREGN
jgi:hypothetical protein